MGQPRELTCWSRTSIRQGMQYMYNDRAGLHPFVGLPPAGEANLLDGFPEAFERKPTDEPTGVESIVRAIQQVCGAFAGFGGELLRDYSGEYCTTLCCTTTITTCAQAKIPLSPYNFVTYRNNLNKIFTTV